MAQPEPIRYVTLRGKRYRFIETKDRRIIPADADGICTPPNSKMRFFAVRPGLAHERALEVDIHEPLHACFWDLDEMAVDEAARDIHRYLWRRGYRRVAL